MHADSRGRPRPATGSFRREARTSGGVHPVVAGFAAPLRMVRTRRDAAPPRTDAPAPHYRQESPMSRRRSPLSSSPAARLRAIVARVRSAVATVDGWLAVGGAGVALARCVDQPTETPRTPVAESGHAAAAGIPRLPVGASALPPFGV